MSSTIASAPAGKTKPAAEEHEILFQKWFKSVGPRTYAVQVKKARNGNHFVALTEGRRDEASGEVRKNRLFIFSEDFIEFFKMLHESAVFVREHPVSAEVKKRQEKHWAKQAAGEKAGKSEIRMPKSVRPGSLQAETNSNSKSQIKRKSEEPASV